MGGKGQSGGIVSSTARGSSALQLQAGQARQTLRRETGQRVVLTFDEVVDGARDEHTGGRVGEDV